MQEQDIQALEREIKHKQMMRKSREGWDDKKTVTTVIAGTARSAMNYYPSVWKSIKTGTEYEK